MNDFERGVRAALEEFKGYLCDENEFFWPEHWLLKESEFDNFVEHCIAGVLWDENK